jgi:hypothetical protein
VATFIVMARYALFMLISCQCARKRRADAPASGSALPN